MMMLFEQHETSALARTPAPVEMPEPLEEWQVPRGMETVDPESDPVVAEPEESSHGVIRRCERSGRYYRQVITFEWLPAEAMVDILIGFSPEPERSWLWQARTDERSID